MSKLHLYNALARVFEALGISVTHEASLSIRYDEQSEKTGCIFDFLMAAVIFLMMM